MSVAVSIIIPFFQSQAVVHLAINGLLTLKLVEGLSFEIVFVDDGSTDDSINIINNHVSPLEEMGYRVVIVRQDNKGPASARNAGIHSSSGEWISFLDIDDFWYRNRFEVLLNYFFDPECDLFCHSEKVRDLASGVELGTNYYGGHFSVGGLMIRGNSLSPSSTIVKRSIIDQVGGFSERSDLIGVEDYDLWIKIAGSKARLKICQDILGEYSRHKSSLSFGYRFYDRVNNLLRLQLAIHKFSLRERMLIEYQIRMNVIKKTLKRIRETWI